jgi:hypothetical protein
MGEVDLDGWVVTVAEALGVDAAGIAVEEVLDLASVAAHSVVRPAAPLTTFVAGLAAGRAGGSPEDIRAAITAASAACQPREDN